MSRKAFAALLLGTVLASPVPAGTLLCCQDPASGRRVCGDTLPSACRNQAHKVIDSQGFVVREVPPPLTPEQKAQKAAAEKQRLLEEEKRIERRRRDSALLERYGTLAEIDRARERAEAEIAQEIQRTEKRIQEAGKRRQKFANEAEFYKKKELPPDIAKGLKDADYEIEAQKNLLASKQRDLETVRESFAEDRRRFIEISSGHLPPTRR